MIIAYVSDSIYPYNKGGKEKRLYEIAKRLAKAGHEIHIYTMHWWDAPSKHIVEEDVHLHAICKLHDMYQGERRSIREGILFALACFKLVRIKADVIDVDHMPFFPVLSMWVVCLLKRQPLYGTWHESLSRKNWTDYMGKLGIIASLIERICVKLPHRITAASQHTYDLLAKLHGRSKNVALVASGIDTKLMNNLTPAETKSDVLFVGRLVKDKNVDTLLLAIAELKRNGLVLSCTIIGDGVERQRLEDHMVKLGLQEQVQFLGQLPTASDVYAYMKAAKVFVLPSIREGFGIVALEALGCGTPVITVGSPANAARFLIKEGVNGSVVSLDPHCLASAIERWSTRKKRPDTARTIMGYDWAVITKKQAEVYTS